MNKIIKIVVFIFLSLLGMYLLFPFWASTVINSKLPAIISLQSLEINYPSLDKVSIRHLQLTSNGMIIIIEDMELNYQLNNFFSDNAIQDETILEKIVIKKMSVRQELRQENADDIFALPEIDSDKLSILQKINYLSIKQLDIFNNNKNINFENFNFQLLKNNKFKLTFTTNNLTEKINSPLNITSTVELNQKNIVLFIEQDNKHLAKIIYSFGEKQIHMFVEINVENSYSLVPENIKNIPFNPKGIMSFDLIQNVSSKNMKLSLYLDGQSQEQFEYSVKAGTINASPIKFTVNTEISVEQKSQAITIENTRFDLVASRLDFITSDDLIQLSADDYKISGTVDTIQSSVGGISESSWKMTGLFSAPKIHAFNESHAIDLNAKAKMKFDLINGDDFSTQGNLILSEMTIREPNTLLKSQLNMKWINIQPSLSEGKISFDFESNGGNVFKHTFETLTLKTDINLLDKQMIGEGEVLLNKQLLTPYSFIYSNDTNDLSIEFKKNQLTNQIINYFLTPIGIENKISLNVTQGDVTHFGTLSIFEKLQAESEVEIKDMLFQFGGNTVKGLNLQQKLTSIDPLTMHSTMSIENVNFSSGLGIKNINAKIDTKADNLIEVKSVVAELLEGKLKAANIKLQAGNIELTSIQLQQLSLTELVFFMDIPGLYGEGKMQFTLPIALKEGVITIEDGTFKASGDGIIKYSNGQSSSAEDENIALKALENFYYKTLEGNISYNERGQYQIKLHLLGSNPDLYDGYPIDFILNLNGELSGVFRSLFLTGNFEQAVMEQVKSTQLDQ